MYPVLKFRSPIGPHLLTNPVAAVATLKNYVKRRRCVGLDLHFILGRHIKLTISQPTATTLDEIQLNADCADVVFFPTDHLTAGLIAINVAVA